METVIHKANTRGHANHGWLNSYHSFSFAGYYNPERVHFGVLRVLNDDQVAAGRGFGTHPHDNMEIISIPLEGNLKHQDNIGNVTVIKEGEIQVMSAGTGVSHSEYNESNEEEVKFLQIWIIPKVKNVAPRYDQLSLKKLATKNSFYQVLSPNKEDQGVWINQDAWFHLGEFDEGIREQYRMKRSENGIYLFVLEGEIEIDGQILEKRDGLGMWDLQLFKMVARKKSKVLVMEVPMKL